MYAACLVHRGERAPQGEAVTGLFYARTFFELRLQKNGLKKEKLSGF